MTMTRADQVALVAPTASGQTGLFNVVTANTLHRGEVSAMVPWNRIKNQGGDRNGFINGRYYTGRFSESGTGSARLATKFSLSPPDAASKFALSLFADLPTGDKNTGISTGGTDWGVGAAWTHEAWTFGGNYKIRGSRSASNSNWPLLAPASIDIPNEWTIEGGLNLPLGWWRTTNWITEATGTFYQGGDFKPDNPIFLVTGLRHWFGDSGWALNAGIRWNVAKFGRNSIECRVTEL